MKNALVLFLAVLTLFLVSCTQNEVSENKNEPFIPPATEENKPVEDTQETPTPKKEEKPETALEIIDFANTFEIDMSMENFSLDGILEEVVLQESDDAGDEYQFSTAYLGDSVTLGLGVFGNHPKEKVIAKGSINPLDAVDKKLIELDDGTLVNFPDALSKLDVERAVLTFGANAISIMSEETFLNCYIMLIDKIKETCPDVEIIIQSISPIATTCTLKKFTNDLINRSNLLLLVLAYSKDVHFLNSAPALKDENGYLLLDYCSSDDGIHINESGYNEWIDYLRRHAKIPE